MAASSESAPLVGSVARTGVARLNVSSTTDDVMDQFRPNLSGKVYAVTGCNSGIGYETARVLGLAGAHVLMLTRDSSRTTEALRDLNAEVGAAGGKVTHFSLNLGDFKSVRACAAAIRKDIPKIHCLINNAGIMALPTRETTVDGLEAQVGTNHVGHFLLTSELMPLLLKDGGATVVCLSSSKHDSQHGYPDDLLSERAYAAWDAYSKSKTSNVAFARELHKRYSRKGLVAHAVHPGVIKTNLTRNMGCTGCLFGFFAACCGGCFLKSIPQGAATTVLVAVSDVEGGHFWKDCQVWDPPSCRMTDEVLASVWATTERLIGEPFGGEASGSASASAGKKEAASESA